MSYRTFKHLIGETSLERKCRFIFGGGILILITASFFWYGRRSEAMVYAQNKESCRLLMHRVLMLHHWINLENMREFRPSIEQLDAEFADMVPGQVKRYEARFIQPGNSDQLPRSDFEYDTIETFVKGTNSEEARVVPGESKYQYLGAVRLTEECMACHATLKSSKISKPGDLYAAVSVQIPLDHTDKEIQANRFLLISMAIVTAVLAMIVFWVIVRYVIAKPVKHLKDVSDAVSAGNLDVRADIATRDEFEELSHAFNRMLRNLLAMQEELRGVNRELDRKVDELATANMALFEMNRLKSDFLATMSHELRTPLNSVIGFSEVLASSDKLSEKERRYAANIQSAGKMLLAMINDLLDLAKIESGKMELHAEEFSIRDVIEGLVTMARPIAEQKNIEIQTEIDPGVPVVYQDAGKIQQILYNLMSNAIKFTPEGGRVMLSVDATATDLVMAVEDTGVGIAPEDRERIFEKFRQGGNGARGSENALTRQYTGSGLGLSIVRELCRMLGGEVTLESELGRGSTFTVHLPLRLGANQQLRVPLSDERIDLSKARRIDAQVLASAKTVE